MRRDQRQVSALDSSRLLSGYRLWYRAHLGGYERRAMMTEFDDQLKAGMRRLVAEKGQKVNFEKPWWDEDDEFYANQPLEVSTYGWTDFDATYHILGHNRYGNYGGPCEWIIPEGAKVTEQTYLMFDGSFTGNKPEVGINAEGVSCKCGKYKNVTLRVTCSLGEAIQSLIGYDSTREMRL